MSDQTWGECATFDQYFQLCKSSNTPELKEFLAQVDKEYTEFAPVLKLAMPDKTLVQCLEEALTAAAS